MATPPFRSKHDPNATCAIHTGYIGNSTEDCWALKYKIQDLINQDILTFFEEKPNVKMNPLPNHSGAAINDVMKKKSLIYNEGRRGKHSDVRCVTKA